MATAKLKTVAVRFPKNKVLKQHDEFLRPYMLSNCNYDIMMGSNGTCTPFRYEINYRNYYLLTQGSAQIKLAPPHGIKYLYPNYDYENFEFSSPINPWTPQSKYSSVNKYLGSELNFS